MSYILEALRKAEAERQLGSAPGVHAAPVHAATPPSVRRARLLLWVGANVLTAVTLVLAWLNWPVAPPVAATRAPAPIAAQGTRPSAEPAAPSDTPLFAPAPVPMPAPAPAPVPAPSRPAPLKAVPKPVETRPAPPAPQPATQPAAPAPAPEEAYPFRRDLPEPVARELPQVAIGGYIYSKTPSERLLLVDKVLRHEGEEVAPGLVLEKLLPKSAVFNYRGFRYQVAY